MPSNYPPETTVTYRNLPPVTSPECPVEADCIDRGDVHWTHDYDRTPYGNLKTLVASTMNDPEWGVQSPNWYGKHASRHIAGMGADTARDVLDRIFDELGIERASYPAAEAM